MKNFNLTQDNKNAKNTIKNFCKSFETQLKVQFEALKKDSDTGCVLKALNERFCKDAIKEGVNLATFYILNFSKYVTKTGIICRKTKNGYKARLLNGNTAKSILRDSVINMIESCRKGNKFCQLIVTITNE